MIKLNNNNNKSTVVSRSYQIKMSKLNYKFGDCSKRRMTLIGRFCTRYMAYKNICSFNRRNSELIIAKINKLRRGSY